ncbi:MAG TPA: HEPN domain-containing protein [Solirubrobacterales bacterium]|nr:HEPN domain-containing protein [Solirubrobacterales bacterium]
MPSPEQTEVAESFARLAAIDLATAEKLAPDPEMDDRPVGFHAQQAVEKAVKAVLMLEGIDFPKTHDLEYLIVVAEKHSAALEPEVKSASWLTPWAAEFRYDDAPIETLDRKRAISVASAAVNWCQRLLGE